MSVEVLIPHFGDDALLKACLASLGDVPSYYHDANTGPNLGFAGNCNLMATLSSADILVFLNNDCVAHDGWLEPLVAALDHHPIAGARLVLPDGQLQHAGVRLVREPGKPLRAENINEYEPPSCEVSAVTGACLAIKADLFRSLGMFDTGFYNGYEDVDLCLQAEQATGLRSWYCAESVLTHDTAGKSHPLRWARTQENVDRLNQKWGER